MFYVCLNGEGTECEYLNSGFNYQSALPLWSRADFSASEVEPGSLMAAAGEHGGAELAGERVPEPEGAGQPQRHGWGGEGLK